MAMAGKLSSRATVTSDDPVKAKREKTLSSWGCDDDKGTASSRILHVTWHMRFFIDLSLTRATLNGSDFKFLLLLIIVLIWTFDAQSFCTRLLHQSIVDRCSCQDWNLGKQECKEPGEISILHIQKMRHIGVRDVLKQLKNEIHLTCTQYFKKEFPAGRSA